MLHLSRNAARLMLALCSLSPVACNAESSSPPLTTATTDPSAVVKVVGPPGGTVKNGPLSVVFPPGLLPSDETITISEVAPSGPAGFTSLSPLYEILPSPLKFPDGTGPEVSYEFQADAVSPVILWSQYDGTGYEALETSVNGNVAVAWPTHFSKTSIVALASTKTYQWSHAPWATNTCLAVTQGYHGSGLYDANGVDLQDPKDCLNKVSLLCPFPQCSVTKNCRNSASSFGQNVCISDASGNSTGRWLFVAHLDDVLSQALAPNIISFQATIGTMGNNGLVPNAKSICKRIHFHIEQGGAADDMALGGKPWPNPPFDIAPNVGNLVCASGTGGSPTPTCSDGVKNQGETGIDCGGPCPQQCPSSGPPSCKDGAICGVDALSCCDSVALSGGTFPMGSPNDLGWIEELPEHSVTVAPFKLDRFEVTVGRFRKFLDTYDQWAKPSNSAGKNPAVSGNGFIGTGWDTTWNAYLPATRTQFADSNHLASCGSTGYTWAENGNDQLPINCVTWYEAFAFCIWDGGRLPTEAEWEFAAAGGAADNTYPWGDTAPDSTKATFNSSCPGGCSTDDIASVGSKPAGKSATGLYDLGGSVWEWTFDYMNYQWYSTGGNMCTNCANMASSSQRTQRGGGWTTFDSNHLRAAFRGAAGPDNRSMTDGFRCARNQ